MAARDPPKKELSGDEPTGPLPWYKQLLAMKDTILIVLTPLIFLPIIFVYDTPAGRCGYGVLIIAVYWCTECLPMAVTALLPVLFMSWLGVVDARDLSKNYLKDANFLFLGGLMIAIAVEHWCLHKRVALRVLMLAGSKPVWITFAFMGVTGFLSMWLPNIPSTAMMIPIAAAVLQELDAHRRHLRELRRQRMMGTEMKPLKNGQGDQAGPDGTTVVVLDGSRKQGGGDKEENVPLKAGAFDEAAWERTCVEEDAQFRRFSCALKLSVTYASNIGGMGTIIGSGPNIVFKGQVEQIFGSQTGMNFFSFFVFAFPHMLVILPIAWLMLMVVIVGPKQAFRPKISEEETGENAAAAVIQREYQKLGPMTWAEAWITGCFLVLATLWVTKEPQFIPGWQSLMPHRYVTDAVVAMTVCIVMFVIPSKRPNILCFKRDTGTEPAARGPSPALLTWPLVHREMQWGVILLLGGGFAIADACEVSQLSDAIGKFLQTFKVLPPMAICLLITVLACTATTFTSNVATATLMLPIIAELARSIEMHPFYLMLPVTIAVNYSYLLPVSTPSNAIIWAYGDITVPDMLKVGSVNMLIHIVTLQIAINTYGSALFNLSEFPNWARKNGTDVDAVMQAVTQAPGLNVTVG